MAKVRRFSRDYDGFLVSASAGMSRAKRMMRNYKNATCLLGFWNGRELFIKENSKVRVSTQKEWEDYWQKRKGGER